MKGNSAIQAEYDGKLQQTHLGLGHVIPVTKNKATKRYIQRGDKGGWVSGWHDADVQN